MSFLINLERTKLRLYKKAAFLAESFPLEDFITTEALKAKVAKEPFPYACIDNFLLRHQYEKLQKGFMSTLAKGVSKDVKAAHMFHAFDMDYDGYKLVPQVPHNPADPLYVFFTAAFNHFFSNLFGQLTTLDTSLAFHHHPAGDRTGFIHNDYVDKNFNQANKLPNQVIPHAASDTPTTSEHGMMVPERRIIALLYYLGNEPWKEGMGGETGLYVSSAKGSEPKVSIAPINNRMLAFQISERSFHTFQHNLVPRNCIVQWFHIPAPLL